jgi:hypothetical protein
MIAPHHQLFELNFGFGLLIVQAEVDVQFHGEVLEVHEPSKFISQILSQEGLKVIESCSLQEGQNVVDLGRIISERVWFGPKVHFALQEEASKIL